MKLLECGDRMLQIKTWLLSGKRCAKAEKAAQGIPSILGTHLEILPGTEYSKYAIPVEYLPSRDFKPRYGYTKRKIHQLEKFFSSRNEE